jgi:BA14K-like protein
MFNTHASIVLGTLLGLSLGATAASAAIVAPPAALVTGGTTQTDAPLLQDARVTIGIGVNQRYNRRMHGNRCSYRHDNCRNYYRGHYYQNQWWILPLVIGSTIANSSHHMNNSHVQWCQDHYRSYNIRTNTWLSNSGQYRQCNSQY